MDAFPIVGAEDDKAIPLPPDASKWTRFRRHPATMRLTHVLVSLAVGILILAIINTTMMPRRVRCVTTEDCRQVRRFNTMLVGSRSFLNITVVVLLLFVILSQLGIDSRALLATAGVVGIVVGFGAQSVIKSMLAGVQVVITGRFSIGDYVEIELTSKAVVKGIIIDFTLASATLQDFSGARYFVSNGDIAVVTNYSQNDQRAQVEVTVSHATNIDSILAHLGTLTEELAISEELIDKVVRPPTVKGVTATGPEAYTIAVAAIVTPTKKQEVERYMRQRILSLLQSLNVRAASKHTEYAPASNAAPLPFKPTEETMTRPDTVRSQGA